MEIEILTIVSAVLGLLLTVSEILAWSTCKYNSITQFVCGLFKPSNPDPDDELRIFRVQ